MPKAIIVYASLTGNTEEMALLLAKEFNRLQIEVEVEEAMQVYPEELKTFDICVVATYTYGTDGDLPDEMIDFYEEMKEVDLKGKVFGVLGSGQRFYEHFCRAVDDFDHRFETTGAFRGATPVKIELNVSNRDLPLLKKFAHDLLQAYQKVR